MNQVESAHSCSVHDIESDALKSMQKARADLLFTHPFFGSLALKLTLKADKDCANLWTDGKTLAYNPHFISILPHEHIIAVQAHEILHIACNHHIRRQGRDARLWNKACDYAVSGLLREAGFILPASLFEDDESYDNMSVDAIYTALSLLEGQETHGGAEQALTTEETDALDEASGGAENEAEGEGVETEKPEKKADSGEDGDGEEQVKTASKSHGADNDQGSRASKTDFFGEIKDHPLLSKESEKDRQRAEEDSLIQITQAIHSAQGHGDVPVGLLRLYYSRVRPSLDWQTLLQRFLENCSDGDYSWSMPNKRYISQNIYLPSRKEARIPLIALAIDASGSVDNTLLSLFCKELEHILHVYDTQLFIMYHDVVVQKHDLYSRADMPLRLHVHGGGGTSYKHIPEYLEKENIQPACLLWFTDFQCNLFPEEPPYPVLWLATQDDAQRPPFGEVVTLNIPDGAKNEN